MPRAGLISRSCPPRKQTASAEPCSAPSRATAPGLSPSRASRSPIARPIKTEFSRATTGLRVAFLVPRAGGLRGRRRVPRIPLRPARGGTPEAQPSRRAHFPGPAIRSRFFPLIGRASRSVARAFPLIGRAFADESLAAGKLHLSPAEPVSDLGTDVSFTRACVRPSRYRRPERSKPRAARRLGSRRGLGPAQGEAKPSGGPTRSAGA